MLLTDLYKSEKMKRILVTAGGTAIAWHICQICDKYFNNQIEAYICDINESFLVPASTIAKDCFKVPLSTATDYLDEIERIVNNNRIDIIIPLIPNEQNLLSKDSSFVVKSGIKTAAPSSRTISGLSDKLLMFKTLKGLKISTPKVFAVEETEDTTKYFVKPRLGFGSLNTSVLTGKQIKGIESIDSFVVQELCDCNEEVTVEVFNGRELKIFARKRVAVKSGVCVKAIPIDSNVFFPIVQKLVENLDMPIAFNLQLFNDKNIWKLFDCNLRLGAGTALATASGFQLTRAFLAELIDEPISDEWLEADTDVKSVLRVYKEVVVK